MRLVFASLALSSFALAQPVEVPTLTDAEKKKLDAGEMVLHDKKPTDNKGLAVESMGVIDAPTSEVWPILRDCQHFSKFMPRTRNSAQLDEDGVKLCHTELGMPFPLANLWSDTRSVQREEPAGHYVRAWTLVRGTYRRNSGSWRLIPWAEGKKTLVVYNIDSDPAVLIPDGLLRAAQAGSLPEVYTSIRKRVLTVREQAAAGTTAGTP